MRNLTFNLLINIRYPNKRVYCLNSINFQLHLFETDRNLLGFSENTPYKDLIHMKKKHHLTIVLILNILLLMPFNIMAQKQHIVLTGRNITIKTAFDQIEKQTGFSIGYNAKIIDVNKVLIPIPKAGPLNDVMTEILKNTDCTFSINQSHIIIFVPEKKTPLPSTKEETPVKRTITGLVTDENREPIIGATVMESNAKSGTITDYNGRFSLEVSEHSIIQISYIGFKPAQIKIGNQLFYEIRLQEEVKILDEVIVVGYGTQKKINLTGSVVSTQGNVLQKSSSVNTSQSLAGRMPGVVVNSRSGEPGSDGATIFIRGRSTLGDNSPLIIVDGIVSGEPLERINPEDIESINILKDASAAIYGARSANGVILVTTKRGKTGKPDITFTYDFGGQQPTRLLKMTDAPTYAMIYNEVLAYENTEPRFSDDEIQKFRDGTDPVNYPNTDWFKEIIKPLSYQHKFNISVNGGTDAAKYFVSVGGNYQDAIYRSSATKYYQINIRSNIDVKVTDNFSIGFDLLQKTQQKNYSAFSDDNYGIFWMAKRSLPTTAGRYPNGLLGPGLNPIALVSDETGYDRSKLNRFNSKLNAKWDLSTVVDGLSVEGNISYNNTSTFRKLWEKPWVYFQYNPILEEYEEKISTHFPTPSLSEYYTPDYSLTLNAIANYQRLFNEVHNLGLMVGLEQNIYRRDYLYASRSKYASDAIDELFAGDADKNFHENSGSAMETARRSFFGRASYDFQGKYLFQFISRYDGSENFPKNKRWGFFPGVSFGWRMSEEGFIKQNFNHVDNLKLRASYGEQGNDRVAAFQYMNTFIYGRNQIFGGTEVNGIYAGIISNPNITWEVAKTYNIGLDGDFFNGKISFVAEAYTTHRSNILCPLNASIPDYTGLVASLPDVNIGIVNNKGFELQLSHYNKISDFNYNIAGNFLFARNRVIYMNETPWGEGHEYMNQEGKPMGSSLMYKVIGINRTDEDLINYPQMQGAKLGDFIFADLDNDGKITSLDRYRNDLTNIPEIVFGLTFQGNWKKFDFMILFQGQARTRQYIYPNNDPVVGNVEQYAIDGRWTPDNIFASKPRLGGTINNGGPIPADYHFKDASFLRLKNMEIGYTVPTKRIGDIKSLRFYVGGYNLLILLDKIKVVDPEMASQEVQAYPPVRIFNTGVKLQF